ncbi:MAG: tripartite tricarboxylate transporter substrate binding protein [Pseudomonadota bacterium]
MMINANPLGDSRSVIAVPRRMVLLGALGALVGDLLCAAEVFPSRVVHIIVPTPPGGPIDRVARAFANAVQGDLGQGVVVDNRVGASGKLGMQAALRSPRDGYTLVALSPSITSVNPVLDKTVGYDALRDLQPLGIAVRSHGVIAARADAPFRSMAEMVAYARAHPGLLTYSSFGSGTSLHLFSEELSQRLGIRLRHIPYKGESSALNALVAGEVDLMMYATAPVVPFVASRRLMALSTTAGRWNALPEVPPAAEAGVPQIQDLFYQSWVGFAVPGGVPPAIAQRLSQSLRTAASQPALRRALEASGFEIAAMDPEDMRRTIAAELERNRQTVAQARITLD